ncbi:MULTISPECIES: hypothetical protein [unclassified Pseudomonas]|uniref:hypothetical protein n=1 Tax=unclassified Pseudomonas TaxID=196821 RepID=UPI001B336DBB|nr:hypothetical protein [Pseudomonas sp. Tri1]
MSPKRVRKQYYLNPFGKGDKALQTSRSKYKLKEEVNAVVIERLTPGCLKSVEGYATLIIDGHGFREDNFQNIISSAESGGDNLSDGALAELVAKTWELPQSHRKIRMLACWGFGFARLFAMQLGTRGYDSICVAGYLGKTSPGSWEPATGRGRTEVDMDNGEGGQYGKDRLVWFDSQGNQCEKPDVGYGGTQLYSNAQDGRWDD